MYVRDLIEKLKQYDDYATVHLSPVPFKKENVNYREIYDIEIQQVDAGKLIFQNSNLLSVLDKYDIVQNIQNKIVKNIDMIGTEKDQEKQRIYFEEICKYLEKHIDECLFGY